MKFQINIYKPGRKPKKVPKLTGEERRVSVAMLVVLMIILLGVIYLAYMNWIFPSIDKKIRWNKNQTLVLSNQLSEVEKDLEKHSNEAGLLSKLHI